MSNKKIKTEPLILTGKRRRENQPEGALRVGSGELTNNLSSSGGLTNVEIKRNRNGYYCCIHSEKEICEIYLCSGNSIPNYNINNIIESYVN